MTHEAWEWMAQATVANCWFNIHHYYYYRMTHEAWEWMSQATVANCITTERHMKHESRYHKLQWPTAGSTYALLLLQNGT